MIRPARRLFDCDGYEIFRSQDIQRHADYYVSGGEDFISPLEAIEGTERLMPDCQTCFFHIIPNTPAVFRIP
jgi:hypothetical protein